MDGCAIEARLRLLRVRNTTGIEVVKAAPDLRLKGLRGNSMVLGRPSGLST
jgi:hypothetical protein